MSFVKLLDQSFCRPSTVKTIIQRLLKFTSVLSSCACDVYCVEFIFHTHDLGSLDPTNSLQEMTKKGSPDELSLINELIEGQKGGNNFDGFFFRANLLLTLPTRKNGSPVPG